MIANHKNEWIKARVFQWKPVAFCIALSKKAVLPGFDRLPLYDVAVFFIEGMLKGSITTRASAMAFHFFLALFPAIIFFFTLIPYVPVDGFQEQLLGLLESVLPANVYDASDATIKEIIKDRKGGLLSFGLLAMLYFSTNGINAMIENFNQTYHAVETRNIILQRLAAFGLMLILSLLMLAAITLIILGKYVLAWLVNAGYLYHDREIYFFEAGKWLIVIALYFFVISFLFFLGPSKRSKWRFISAGATLATLLSVAASLLFAWFVNNFGQYNKLYGSIGTLIALMIWIYFNSIILLIGFELNASIKSAGKNV